MRDWSALVKGVPASFICNVSQPHHPVLVRDVPKCSTHVSDVLLRAFSDGSSEWKIYTQVSVSLQCPYKRTSRIIIIVSSNVVLHLMAASSQSTVYLTSLPLSTFFHANIEHLQFRRVAVYKYFGGIRHAQRILAPNWLMTLSR